MERIHRTSRLPIRQAAAAIDKIHAHNFLALPGDLHSEESVVTADIDHSSVCLALQEVEPPDHILDALSGQIPQWNILILV